MAYAHANLTRHTQISEAAGWVTLGMSALGLVSGVARIFGAITVDGVNQWLILIGSTITGGVAVVTLAIVKIHKARLEGQTLERVYAANNRAIELGQPIPYPEYMPQARVVVKTETKVEVKPEVKPAPPPEAK